MIGRFLELIGVLIAMYVGALVGYYIYASYAGGIPSSVKNAIGVVSILYLGLALAAIGATLVHVRRR